MVKRVQIAVASGRGVAERWRSQYFERDGKWSRTVSGNNAEDVYNKLCDLGQAPDVELVAGVIGNQSWSYLSCSGCGDYVVRAANFGSDYSDATIQLCKTCLEDGLAALTKSQ